MEAYCSIGAFLAIVFAFYFHFLMESRIDPLPFVHVVPSYELTPSKFVLVKHYDLKGKELLFTDDGNFFLMGGNNGNIRKVHTQSGEIEALVSSSDFLTFWQMKSTHKTTPAEKCDKILGMKFDTSGDLIFAHAELGIFRFLFKSSTLELLSNDNSLSYADVIQDPSSGLIYYTEPSHKYGMEGQFETFAEYRGNGRIYSLDPLTKRSRKLFDGLFYPNGIQILYDHHLYILQTMNSSLIRVDLRKNDGSFEMISQNLPIMPHSMSIDRKTGNLLLTGLIRQYKLESVLRRKQWNSLFFKLPRWIVTKLCVKMTDQRGAILEIDPSTGEIVNHIFDDEMEVFKLPSAVHKRRDGYYYVTSDFHNTVRFKVSEEIFPR